MTLFDLLAPVAISGAIGVCYGSTMTHGAEFGAAIVLGVMVGSAMTVAMYRATTRVFLAGGPNLERRLALMYGATFASVFTVTLLSVKGILWGLR